MPSTGDTSPAAQPRGLGRVIGRVAPSVIRQLDLDALVQELDVNAIAARLNPDALVQELDIDAIAQRLDLDALLGRIDLDQLVARLDVNAIALRLDMNEVANRLDVQSIADRMDLNAVAERLDVDQLIARIDMAQLTAGATQDVATSGLDLARRQLMRADSTIDRAVSGVLRRSAGERPAAPGAMTELVDDSPVVTDDDSPPQQPNQRREVSGHYAGPASRLLALGADTVAAVSSFGLMGGLLFFLLHSLGIVDSGLGDVGWLQQVLLAAWMLLWFWLPVSWFGRTPAMALVGLAVLARDGTPVTPTQAVLRAIAIPLSLMLLGLGLLGIVVGRERRALHDVVGGTCVVYDWGARDAEMPASIREQLSARVQRRQRHRVT